MKHQPKDVSRRILILGGTGDARGLAGRLVTDGHQVISSLAGITEEPEMPEGEVRTGGFGGVEGLATYLESEAISLMIDATHPFAVQISANATAASDISGIELVRLERPVWTPLEGDNWTAAKNTGDAVRMLETGACAFVTIGRKDIGQFSVRRDIRVIARMIEPPEEELPDGWKIILARPPFTQLEEMGVMGSEGVTVLVSKNAGGPTRTKLDAARIMGIPVIMIDRPAKPKVRTVSTFEEIADLLAKEEI